MKRFLGWSAALTILVCLLLALPAVAGKGKKQEKEVTLDQVPAAVKETIVREAGDHKITEIEEVSIDGKVAYYEAEWKADGKEVEIEVAPDGELLKKEIEDDDDDD